MELHDHTDSNLAATPNPDRQSATAKITINVQAPPPPGAPIPSITAPADSSSYCAGQGARTRRSGTARCSSRRTRPTRTHPRRASATAGPTASTAARRYRSRPSSRRASTCTTYPPRRTAPPRTTSPGRDEHERQDRVDKDTRVRRLALPWLKHQGREQNHVPVSIAAIGNRWYHPVSV
jgi:hypothetical protein